MIRKPLSIKDYKDMEEIYKDMKELYRDIEEIAEIIRCDADDSIKCKMISDVLTAKPHYFEEP